MIVISHRGPYRFERNDDGSFEAHRGGGGIVSALSPLLGKGSDGIWIASAMSDDDRAAAAAGVLDPLDVNLHLIDVEPAQYRMHYDVVANGVLWFLHHGMFDAIRRPRFDIHFRDAWDAYVAVNDAFAVATAEHAPDGDVVLVQDYQLTLLPGALRKLRPDLKVVHFSHTPFAAPDDIRMLPPDVAEALCASLASVPAGFHTVRWTDCFRRSRDLVLGPGTYVDEPFVASLGPDVDELETVAATRGVRTAGETLADAVGERMVVLRNDRMDPSKNIVRGFYAYDRLLEARPGLRGRVVFVAMLYPTRQGLAEYLAYANEVEQIVARVNERWATRDWTPIILDDRDDFERSVAGMQRYDVLFVNPIRDGLNLVAKEGPVLNRRDGVLCLSPEAGAYDEMADGAIAVHPFDIEQAAAALDTALSMPFDEREARAKLLRTLAVARNPGDWLADLLNHAR